MAYLYLLLAVIAEVVATSALKASDEFTRFWPMVVVVVGYGLAFYLLTLVFRTMPVGVVYAIWSGAGVALITLMGIVVFKEVPDVAAIVGLLLIVSGVLVINLFSNTSSH
ncbi:MAG: DMT family transporter [Granulosicoccaceae bacterium]